MEFALRFDADEIPFYAARYPINNEDLVAEAVHRATVAGYFSKHDFLILCNWKSPRTRKRCEKNSEEFIKAVTQTSFLTRNEQLRIEVLTRLNGVQFPTASVFLHFTHSDQYPILDYRALWSLCADVPPYYTFPFWWDYAQYCRKLAKSSNVSMRTLDRALWQYSKEHQPSGQKPEDSEGPS